MHIRRSPRALSHRSLVANFGADPAENEPVKVSHKFAETSTPRRRRGAGRPILLDFQGKLMNFFLLKLPRIVPRLVHICRSPRALSHNSLLANFDVDPAENEPVKVWQNLSRLPRLAGGGEPVGRFCWIFREILKS